ncbi:MAG TPA: MarR family transcriptional regulator [Azospirillaceae bacterium]|nr:MarR family transcriptional regulator [Azospirillaceae bacterium]
MSDALEQAVPEPERYIDHETAARPGDHRDLRLWLRLLSLTTLVENEVRGNLRVAFDTTLPRFDFLAALHKANGALTMGDLSRRLMVSNGNVTGLAERLVEEGLVLRSRAKEDKRTQLVALTPKGRQEFERMAARHEEWIAAAFAGLSDRDAATLMDLLGRAKDSVRRSLTPPSDRLPTAPQSALPSPLPGGEGQGEGVRDRGAGANFNEVPLPDPLTPSPPPSPAGRGGMDARAEETQTPRETTP